jgi:hypothetical protein
MEADLGGNQAGHTYTSYAVRGMRPFVGSVKRSEVQKAIDRFAPAVAICQAPKAPSIQSTATVVEQAREDSEDKKELSSVMCQMDGFAAQCVERYLELSNQRESCLKEAPTPSLDETAFSTADWETKGELAGVCAKI